MGYATKEQDHEKRKNQEGSYSVYNFMYHYLMDNFEPGNFKSESVKKSAERELIYEGREYCLEGGNRVDDKELATAAKDAIANFIKNDGEHGDTADNFGNRHENQLDTIKQSLADLRW